MKLNISYSYDQEYLPTKRHRKSRSVVVDDHASFEIEELYLEDFPLAFEVEDYSSVYAEASYDNSNSIFQLFREEIRTFQDALYKPMRYGSGAAISTEFLPLEEIEKNICAGFRKYHYQADLPMTEKSILLADKREEILRKIQKEVDNLVFCDGCFWKVCRDPMYLVHTFGLGHNAGGTGFFVEDYYNGNISHRNYFTALQREEAIQYALDVATRRGDTNSLDNLRTPKENITVHMPEMVRRNPAVDHGDGDPFMNKLYGLTEVASSAFEAECLVMAATAAECRR